MQDLNPDAVMVDGYDDCIINIVEGFGIGCVFLYDTNKILKKLMKEDGMNQEEAYEYFEYNILGAYISEYNPLFTVVI